MITDESGAIRATYGYAAYGKDDPTLFTGVDKPDQANPDKPAYNTYRFNAKPLDASTGTYDIGFRTTTRASRGSPPGTPTPAPARTWA